MNNVDTSQKILEVFIQYLLIPLCTATVGAIVWGAKKLGDKWTAESAVAKQAGQSNLMATVGAKVAYFAANTVHDLEGTLKAKMEAAAADGVITPEEAAELRQAAIAQLKNTLGTDGLKEVTDVLGVGAGALGGFLGGAIEKAVAGVGKAPAAIVLAAPAAAPVAAPLAPAPGGLVP